MPTRIRHDDPTITTYDGGVIHRGATSRPAVEWEAGTDTINDDVVRLVLDSSTYFTVPQHRSGGAIRFLGAFETTVGARELSGENHLINWVQDRDLDVGRTVYGDEVVPGYRFGLRAPGETARYEAGHPDPGLEDIARDL